MIELLEEADRFVLVLLVSTSALALLNAGALVLGRMLYWLGDLRRQGIQRSYGPLMRRALDGDNAALQDLRFCPPRYRIFILQRLIAPLYDQQDPAYGSRARAVFDALSGESLARHLLNSRRWWRRAMAIRALGILQVSSFTPAIVAALDDGHPEVRAVALDALADLRDPASLPGLVVRLNDESLPHARRLAAIAAFGTESEPLLLDLATMDTANRLGCALALRICGTRRALPLLCDWTRDPDPDTSAAALTAIEQVGLDDRATRLAMDALTSPHVQVRRAAARTLRLAAEDTGAAARLADHLGDAWPVAFEAARSLRSMGTEGIAMLRNAATVHGLSGVLARQMLWDDRR